MKKLVFVEMQKREAKGRRAALKRFLGCGGALRGERVCDRKGIKGHEKWQKNPPEAAARAGAVTLQQPEVGVAQAHA